MPLTKNILFWSEQLHQSVSFNDVCTTLCRALTDIAPAQKAGLFLFDPTSTFLQLFCLQNGGTTIPALTEQFIYENQLDDPLAHAIHSGSTYSFSLCGASSFLSINMLIQQTKGLNSVLAIPLKSPRSAILGGILLGFSQQSPTPTQSIMLLIHQAAALLSLQKLRQELQQAQILFKHSAQKEPQRPLQEPQQMGIIGNSRALHHTFELAQKAATTSATVLLTGETGTGKELFATAIHLLSPRHSKPFVTLNCTAIPHTLLESELFGYAKGAFSGAHKNYLGLLRSAEEGSILLDEIGDMPLEIQAKLLRFLQDKTVRPIGTTTEFTVNVHVIAATNVNLQKAVQQGTFRADLYHRLAVFPILIPPLRERREDILPLIEYFLKHYAALYKKPKPHLDVAAIGELLTGDYPGNVRELAANIERLFILNQSLKCASSITVQPTVRRLPEMVNQYEKELIASAFTSHQGNTLETANYLGIPRRTLAHKLRMYAIDPPFAQTHIEEQDLSKPGAYYGNNA